jgi:CRP/FNR family transcriptional regulator, anaerobic regulatory protein
MSNPHSDTHIQQIKFFVNGIVTFSNKEWNNFESVLHFKKFKKGDFLCKAGDIEKKLYFILSGIVRAFKVNDEGKEFSLYFNFENEFSTSFDSFLTQNPAVINTQALTDLTVFYVLYDDLQKLYSASIEGERLGRIMAEQAYRRRIKREMDLLTLTATERYSQLLKDYPAYIQNIPQKYLSSYLGIEQESLSRIKKSLLI